MHPMRNMFGRASSVYHYVSDANLLTLQHMAALCNAELQDAPVLRFKSSLALSEVGQNNICRNARSFFSKASQACLFRHCQQEPRCQHICCTALSDSCGSTHMACAIVTASSRAAYCHILSVCCYLTGLLALLVWKRLTEQIM